MIDLLFTCFIYYNEPNITKVNGYTFKTEGVALPVGQYRDTLYIMDAKYVKATVRMTNKTYGDYPVCKIIGENIDK